MVPLVEQTTTFIADLPQIVRDSFGRGGSLDFIQRRVNVIGTLSRLTPSDVLNAVAGNRTTILNLLTTAASTAAAVVTILTIMVMLLIEGPRAWNVVLDWMVSDERAWAERIGDNFLEAVGGYVRGNLLISVIAEWRPTSSCASSALRTRRRWPCSSRCSTSSRWWAR